VPFARLGDTAATHPVVMRGHTPDPRTVNEVFGFVLRCATLSAAHLTDYLVDVGTTWMMGGSETPRLCELAEQAGYWAPAATTSGHACYRLLDDADFLHIRLRDEVEWERQQRNDSRNPALTVPVRHRDGDSCRYCGRYVNFGARQGEHAGTYDHRVPGQPATVDTLVVSCGPCNSGRRDHPDADERYPLRPVPAPPLYTTRTVAFLAERGITVHPNITSKGLRLDLQSSAAPGSVPRPPTAPAEQPQALAPVDIAHAHSGETLPVRSSRGGSGRVGSGRVGPSAGSGSGRRGSRGGRRQRQAPPPAGGSP